jgi:hypothetical protein
MAAAVQRALAASAGLIWLRRPGRHLDENTRIGGRVKFAVPSTLALRISRVRGAW